MKKAKKRSTFKGNLREYLDRSQVQGYKFIIQRDRPLYERVLWILITIFGVLLTFWLVINSYLDFLVSPTVTSEDPIGTSVFDLGFPAVTICNANRISRKALMKYAKFILNATRDHHQNIGRSVDEISKMLVHVGQMYTMDLSEGDYDKLKLIHSVLNNVNGGSYQMYDILSKLAPNCTDLLRACKWKGHFAKCSEIFSTRKSFMGPCCSFNYQRPTSAILKNQQQFNHTIPKFEIPQRVNSHEPDFGLTVLVDHQLNDYMFTMDTYIGTTVLVHDTIDFPDQTSGSTREKIISPQQEVYLIFNPIYMQGSESMKTFTISSRNCVFDDEINLVFAKFYSLSECLLTCRLSNIIQFCGCTPPQFTNLFNSSMCTLTDLDCLNRWRINWYTVEPVLTSDSNLDEVNDYHCPGCIPKCERMKYSLDTSECNLDPHETMKRSHDPQFLNFTDVTNHSIVYINFGSNKIKNYDQTPSYVWYELLANLGAVGCLSLGATMVSIMEIIYFFSGKLGAIWIRKFLQKMDRRKSKFDYLN